MNIFMGGLYTCPGVLSSNGHIDVNMACDESNVMLETLYWEMQLERNLQIINMEWGNFRSPYLPRTFADEEVDIDSVNPGDQVRFRFVELEMEVSK